MIMRICVLWLMGSISCMMVYGAELKNITLSQLDANKTSLYFTVSGSFTHKLFVLNNPGRVVIDFSGTHLGVTLKQLSLTNSLIKQVRSGAQNADSLRLVLDINQNVQVSSAPMPSLGAFNGIRIDLVKTGPATKSIALTNTRQSANIKVTQTIKNAQFNQVPIKIKSAEKMHPVIAHNTPIKVPHSPSSKYLRDVIVVLDAGHGGKDPGARGPRNSKEKDVVLAITLKLKQLIDKHPGMRAVLTRSGDYYVGLRQRLDIARKYNGDVFVSIHADAFNNPHSNGASVFALSQRGATSEAARWIAEKENYSELGGVNLGDLDDTNGVVRSVLIDLSQTATINAGLQMGGRVLGQLYSFTNLHNNKVEQARFVVLKSPDIPSILVETGFISNPREERNLTSSAYQTRLSRAIFSGVKGYFWDNPPHGTRIEAMTTSNFHLVRAGETLPAIAARYHVSTDAVQVLNHLTDKPVLKSGQKLMMPSAWS